MSAENGWSHIINGESVEPSSDSTIEVDNPSTGEHFATVPNGNTEDLNAAVDAARDAFEEWREVKPEERGEYLFELADRLESHHDELVQLETKEMGKPLFQSENDVTNGERITQFYAGAADKIRGDTILDSTEEVLKTIYEPYGVVGIIIPWNWPPIHTTEFSTVAIATGNTVVLKPSPEAPLCSLRIAEIAADVLPPGVLNVVSGATEAGVALTGHDDVDKLAFTGSDKTGEKVIESAAAHITPTMLELGGKNPALVFPEADLEKTVSGLIYNAFYNSGQACTNPERFLIHESMFDEFMDEFAARVKDIVVGNSMDERTEVGPQVSAAHRENVLGFIERAQAEGASIRAQATLPDDLEDGYYVPPTVFDEIELDMEIVSNEVFGPVVAPMAFENEAEAIELANGVEYGLAASIWTQNVNRAHRVANQLEAGIITINHPTRGRQGVPFGGYKRSGMGRKKGLEETMREYMQVKSVQMDLTDKQFSFSYGNR